jgi:hypothetical protein
MHDRNLILALEGIAAAFAAVLIGVLVTILFSGRHAKVPDVRESLERESLALPDVDPAEAPKPFTIRTRDAHGRFAKPPQN